MDDAFLPMTLHVLCPAERCGRFAARVSIGFEHEPGGEHQTLLCIWRFKGAPMLELALTEEERLELIKRLTAATPRCVWETGLGALSEEV